ncbi:MAG TPA: ABC transporter permease [Rhizomicrobium sp.]|nr:ABC transporter permease [Rhizomicrobium sp.]
MAAQDQVLENPSFATLLVRQARIIGALTMREVHVRYGRKNIGFLWIVAEPFLFTFGVIALRSLLPIGTESRGMPLVGFLMTGYTPFLLYRHMVGHSIHCIEHNQNVLYHRQVKFLDLFLGNYILETAGILMAFVSGCAIFIAAGMLFLPKNPALLLAGWFYAVWFSAALALLVGALSPLTTLVEKLYNPLSYLSLPLSGAFFLVDWLPSGYAKLALWIPMVNYFEMIRGGYFGAGVQVHFDALYLTLVCLALTFAALATLRSIRRRVSIR